MESFLRHGHYITLSGSLPGTGKNSQNRSGCLSTTGFTEARVFFQSTPPPNQSSIIRNNRDFIFQVWPKMNYEAHKEFRRNEKAIQTLKGSEISKKDDNLAQNLIELEQSKESMSERMRLEKEINFKNQETFYGQQVNYGMEIQLMHVDSKMFLNGKIIVSNADRSSYKLELSENYGAGMLFKFLPKYKLRQEGEAIQYSDQILLFNVKLNNYINYTMDIPIDIDRPLQVPKSIEKPYKSPDIGKLDKYAERFEAYLSQYSDIVWQINGHYKMNKKLANSIIFGGDLIRLRHTETNNLLCADVSYDGEDPEVFLRSYDGEFPTEGFPVGSIWMIEQQDDAKERGKPCLFQEETGQDKYISYRLRHFLTGKRMTMRKKNLKSVKTDIPVLMSYEEEETGKDDPNSYFQLHPTIFNMEKTLKSGFCFNICAMENQFFEFSKTISFESNKNRINPDQCRGFYEPLEDKELMIRRNGVITAENKSFEHAFMIEKLSEMDVEYLFFLRSSHQILQRLIQVFRFNLEAELNSELTRKVIKTLTSLIYFVLKTENKDNPYECEGITSADKQHLMKEMLIIDLLTDILHYPFQSNMYKIDKLSNLPADVLKIFRLCYRLIKFIIKEYRPNELYASQWIELMMIQSLQGDANCDILAEVTLKELIDNNKIVLETKIKKETIERFIETLLEDPKDEYIELLRALCVVDGEPMIVNQSEISKIMLENQFHKEKLLLPIRTSDKAVEVMAFDKEYITLETFHSKSNERDKGDRFNYFVSLINLLSDLCLNKNYIAIDQLKPVYSHQNIYIIISNPNLSFDLKSAFVRLLTTLWIEGSQNQPLNIPNLIRTWEDLASNRRRTISNILDTSEFSPFKDFIKSYLAQVTKDGFQRVFQTEANLFTYYILLLVKSMIIFGVYNDPSEINPILRPLLSILCGAFDAVEPSEERAIAEHIENIKSPSGLMEKFSKLIKITLGNQQSNVQRNTDRYKENEQSDNLNKCKEIICDLLKIIFEIRNDLRVTSFMSEFRGDFEKNTSQSLGIEANSNLGLEHSRSKSGGQDEMASLVQPRSPEKKKTFGMLGFLEDLLNSPENNDGNKESDIAMKWLDQIVDRKDIDLLGNSPFDLRGVLIDIMLYERISLGNKAFYVLYSLFSQRQQLCELLEQTQLLEDQKMITNYDNLRRLKQKFRKMADESENWYSIDSSESKKTCTEILHIIGNICDMIVGIESVREEVKEEEIPSKKQDYELDDYLEEIEKTLEDKKVETSSGFNKFLKRDEIDFFPPGFKVNKENQKLVRNMLIQEPTLDIIKMDSALNSKGVSLHSQKVLKACYKLLALFCFEDPIAQSYLEPHLKLFLRHMKKNHKSNNHLLVLEYFKNNKKILLNARAIQKTVQLMVSHINDSEDLSYKVSSLYSLRIFLKYRHKVIKANQTILINIIGSPTLKNLIFPINSKERVKDLLVIVHKFGDELLNNEADDIKVPQELEYFAVLLQLMALCSEEKNAASESRCQTLFPLKSLWELLSSSENCWYFKKVILFFVYHVFLDTEREFLEERQTILSIFKEMVKELAVMASSLENLDNRELITFKGTFRIKKVKLDFIFSTLLPCLSICLRKHHFIPEEEVEILEGLIQSSVTLSKNIDRKFYRQDMTSFLALLTRKKNIMMLIHYDQTYQTQFPPEFFTDEPTLGLKSKTTSVNFGGTLSDSQIREISRSEKLRKKIEDMKKSQKYLDNTEGEFELLVKTIIHIEKKSSQDFSGICTITFPEICKSLMDMVDPTDMTLSPKLSVIGLKTFRKIIELENKSLNTPAADWETEDYENYSKKIKIRQNELTKVGVVTMVCNMIALDVDLDLKNEAVLFGIALLLGGNSRAQVAFYNYLCNDSKNNFLWNIKNMIETYFSQIKKSMDNLNRSYKAKFFESQDFSKGTTTVMLNQDKKNASEEETIKEYEEDDIQLISHCKRCYRLLQLFCEGHYLDMQNFLRVQTQNGQINGRSQNFISITTLKFGTVIKFMNVKSTGLADQIIDFLIEVIQGPCPENQTTLSKTKIVDFIKDLLSMFIKSSDYQTRGFLGEEEKNEVNNIVTKSTTLLYSMIEGNTDDKIMEFLIEKLDFKFIKTKLIEEYASFIQQEMKLPLDSSFKTVMQAITFERFDGNIADAFQMYILVKSLASNLKNKEQNNPAADILAEESEKIHEKEALKFFDENTNSIEIFFQNKLFRIFFLIQPVCRNISMQSRKKLMSEVKRTSPNEKIMGLVQAAPILFDEMEHMCKLKTYRIQFTPSRLNSFRDLSTLLALALNILIIASFRKTLQVDEFTTYIRWGLSDDQDNLIQVLVIILGIIQIVTSSLMLIFWLMLYAPLISIRKWREYVVSQQKYTDDELDDQIDEEMETGDVSQLSSHQTRYLLRVKGPSSKYFKKNGNQSFGNTFTTLLYYWKCIVFLFGEASLRYIFFYIIISLVGCLYSPLLYSFHLLDIINRFETLKNVIRSVTRNANQLSLTLFLGIVIIYVFSLIGFFFLNDYYWEASLTENQCASMFQCWLTTILLGLRSGGGIADKLTPASFEDTQQDRFMVRFFFDILFWLIINIIFLNIIFGIIIDTFAALRDEKSRIDADMRNLCFICNLDRYTFDKNSDGFDAHIDRDHRLWNYLYYIYYVKSKDKTDFSGIESYIYQKLEEDDSSWFPMLKAMCLGEAEDKVNIKDLISSHIGNLSRKIDEIATGIDDKKNK